MSIKGSLLLGGYSPARGRFHSFWAGSGFYRQPEGSGDLGSPGSLDPKPCLSP